MWFDHMRTWKKEREIYLFFFFFLVMVGSKTRARTWAGGEGNSDWSGDQWEQTKSGQSVSMQERMAISTPCPERKGGGEKKFTKKEKIPYLFLIDSAQGQRSEDWGRESDMGVLEKECYGHNLQTHSIKREMIGSSEHSWESQGQNHTWLSFSSLFSQVCIKVWCVCVFMEVYDGQKELEKEEGVVVRNDRVTRGQWWKGESEQWGKKERKKIKKKSFFACSKMGPWLKTQPFFDFE